MNYLHLDWILIKRTNFTPSLVKYSKQKKKLINKDVMNPSTQSSLTRIPPTSLRSNQDLHSPKWACRANLKMLLRCCKTTKKSNKLHPRLRKTYEKLNNLMKINIWKSILKVLGTSKRKQLRQWVTLYQRNFQSKICLQTNTLQLLKRLPQELLQRSLASLTWKKIQILTKG